MNVLITCGPTWVAIDDVRVISNHSTGQMGHLMAHQFAARGARVTLIEGPVTHAWVGQSVKVIKYQFFDELVQVLKTELRKKYDMVVHAAAVSDFKVAKIVKGKIASAKSLSLTLIPTPKLIEGIKKIAPKIFLVGFKFKPYLNTRRVAQETRALFDKAHCDLVVANSIQDGYRGFIVDKEGHILAKATNKKILAKSLVKNIVGAQFIAPAKGRHK
ncbi:MAG: phosphopantothenoylcysteine decarboxylase [Candidatus Omnitrophica bacterium]|nr:phosphopantothenoylcysteine decarboxylase [Candidatus Omnitrophota bacterium]